MADQAKIYIGTSGWSYPKGEGKWTGYFYPTGKINELEYYSQFFNTVEINSSFNSQPILSEQPAHRSQDSLPEAIVPEAGRKLRQQSTKFTAFQ